MKYTYSAACLWIVSVIWLTASLTACAESSNGPDTNKTDSVAQSSAAKAIVYRVDASRGVVDVPASPAPNANASPASSQKPAVAPMASVEVVPAETQKAPAIAAPITKAIVAQNQQPEAAPTSVAGTPLAPTQKPQAAPMPAAVTTAAPSHKPLALAPFKKPAWLTDMSFGVKEGYDDNVYMSGVDKKFLPATYTVPAGSVAALKDRWSWVTTVSAKVGVDFAPVLKSENLQTASFLYAPDIVRYTDQPAENNDAHRFTTTIKGKADAFSWNLNNSFVYVDGSRFGPVYPGNLLSAWNTVASKERREQIQDRANPVIQYDQENWFVRGTASVLDYNMMTKLLDVEGYQNYESRYDVNGGADLGYKIEPQLATTFGYRYGSQYQQKLFFSPYSSPSDYQRLLFGLEGKPWKIVEVKLQGGPDFRDYAPDTATHITPVGDKSLVTYYGEAVIIVKPSPQDAVTFKYRGFQWVSCLGKVPYFDSYYDLGYNRKLAANLTLDLGARLATADYNSGDLKPSNHRDDWMYTLAGGLGYALNANLSLTGSYSMDLGRNEQDVIANAQTRNFEHYVVSLGAKYNF